MAGLDGSLDARTVIRLLGLKPHPEGGHYAETFRDPANDADGRCRSTAIYFLLDVGEVSEWHRVDATEIWHWHAGHPWSSRSHRTATTLAPTISDRR